MARDHITYLQPAQAGEAKPSEDAKVQANVEAVRKLNDPTDAQKRIDANTKQEVDGNGSGVKFTTKAATEKQAEDAQKQTQQKASQEQTGSTTEDEDQRKRSENEKNQTTEQAMQISSPASSKEQGGVDTTTQVKR